jgi:hypothetical protein
MVFHFNLKTRKIKLNVTVLYVGIHFHLFRRRKGEVGYPAGLVNSQEMA